MTYMEERRLLEHDVPDILGDVNVDDIITAIHIVAMFNKPLYAIEVAFLEYLPSGIDARGKVANAYRSGGSVFENLTREAPQLADAIHEFVYRIVCPLSSITVRDLTREQVARVVLSIK